MESNKMYESKLLEWGSQKWWRCFVLPIGFVSVSEWKRRAYFKEQPFLSSLCLALLTVVMFCSCDIGLKIIRSSQTTCRVEKGRWYVGVFFFLLILFFNKDKIKTFYSLKGPGSCKRQLLLLTPWWFQRLFLSCVHDFRELQSCSH